MADFDIQKYMEQQEETQKLIDATMKFQKEYHPPIYKSHYKPRAHGSIVVLILCFVIVVIVSKLCKKCRSRTVITPPHQCNYFHIII